MYLVLLIFGGFGWARGERPAWSWSGMALAFYLLIGLLGYRVFGSPIKD